MPYLIDGHNLIPNIPGLSLSDVDDEQRLIGVLQEFCRQKRKTVEVYFDQALPGMPAKQKFGPVQANFVRRGTTADQAIMRRLQSLKRQAANWIVVSSDLQVQAAAREARSAVISSAAFAAQLTAPAARLQPERPDPSSDETDLEEWLRLFGE